MDITTLHGESLGRVNRNKLKPCQKPETTQAYALQILACHILEAEIRAKKNHLHKKKSTPQFPITIFSQSNKEIISHTRCTPYQDQETLEVEDLEVHQVMLEGYWAQPSKLGNNKPQHVCDERSYSPKENNTPIGHSRKTFGNSVQTPKEDVNPTYPTPLDLEKGRRYHSSK